VTRWQPFLQRMGRHELSMQLTTGQDRRRRTKINAMFSFAKTVASTVLAASVFLEYVR
jgi:hypothetical protein